MTLSKDKKKQRGCEGKKRFVTQQYAERWGTRFPGFRDMNAYKCEFCGLWHLGHPNPAYQEMNIEPPQTS